MFVGLEKEVLDKTVLKCGSAIVKKKVGCYEFKDTKDMSAKAAG